MKCDTTEGVANTKSGCGQQMRGVVSPESGSPDPGLVDGVHQERVGGQC